MPSVARWSSRLPVDYENEGGDFITTAYREGFVLTDYKKASSVILNYQRAYDPNGDLNYMYKQNDKTKHF